MKKSKHKICLIIFTAIFVIGSLVALAKYTVAQDKEKFLVAYEMDTMTLEERIEYLDSSAIKPEALQAQLTPTNLMLSDGKKELNYEANTELFYLSFAPYIDQTHPCFNHVMTGCQGEQALRTFDVTIKDSKGLTLFEGEKTTARNGFAGVWLPRNIQGTIEVSADGKTARSEFGTSDQDGTCLTTLQLL